MAPLTRLVLVRVALVRVALVSVALVRVALVRVAFVSVALVRVATSAFARLALVSVALVSVALVRVALVRVTAAPAGRSGLVTAGLVRVALPTVGGKISTVLTSVATPVRLRQRRARAGWVERHAAGEAAQDERAGGRDGAQAAGIVRGLLDGVTGMVATGSLEPLSRTNSERCDGGAGRA